MVPVGGVECEVEGLSEYEQLRLENIRRNHTFLTATLGLTLLPSPADSNFKLIGKRGRSPHPGDRQVTPKRTKAAAPSINDYNGSLILRRSSRVATLPSVNYTEVRISYCVLKVS